MAKHIWKITIDDGLDEVEYTLQLRDDISINNIKEVIVQAFKGKEISNSWRKS